MFSTALPAIATITSPVNAFEIPSASTAGSMASTNHSETSAAMTPETARSPIARPNGRTAWDGSTSAASDRWSDRR
jgi:hypothetical protein